MCGSPSGPSWTDVLTAFSALSIGLVGVYFAWLQHQLNERQFRHDLYDRRMAIYVAASKAIAYLFREGELPDEALFEFLRATRESDFLLNDEVTARLDEMYKKGVDLQTRQFELQDLPVGEERSNKVREAGEIKKWWVAQGAELKRLFTPFLKL